MGFGGFDGHLGGALFTVLYAGFSFFVFAVLVGLIVLLVRFLLVATKAAQLYISNNTPSRPQPPAPASTPAAATPSAAPSPPAARSPTAEPSPAAEPGPSDPPGAPPAPVPTDSSKTAPAPASSATSTSVSAPPEPSPETAADPEFSDAPTEKLPKVSPPRVPRRAPRVKPEEGS